MNLHLRKYVIVPVAAALLLSGCDPTKQDVGTLIGAGTGAFVGTHVGSGKGQLAAVAIGTLLGGYIGGNIGQQMDDLDRYKANETLEKTPTGKSTAWNNPDTGNHYKMTPTRTYNNGSGPCRDYTTEAVIDGRSEVVHGTACRESDGSWHAMN